MFRAAYRSSSGALTLFAASDLHTHVVTGRNQVWVRTDQFPLRLDYGRSPHAYVNQRLQIELELLMMSGIPFETCWDVNERWKDKFSYKVASCWLYILIIITTLQGTSIWIPRLFCHVTMYLPNNQCLPGEVCELFTKEIVQDALCFITNLLLQNKALILINSNC
jgi:hypothetical protein